MSQPPTFFQDVTSAFNGAASMVASDATVTIDTRRRKLSIHILPRKSVLLRVPVHLRGVKAS